MHTCLYIYIYKVCEQKNKGGYQSGQMGQTVNLLSFFLGKEEVLSSTLSYSSTSA